MPRKKDAKQAEPEKLSAEEIIKKHKYLALEQKKLERALRARGFNRNYAPLNPKQQEYIDGILKGKTKQRAAKDAGYAAPPGGEAVRREYRRVIRKAMSEYEITAKDVLLEIRRMGMVNLADLYDEDGKLLPITELSEDVQRAIVGVEHEELYEWDAENHERNNSGYVRKVKTAKEKALEMLAKYHKLLSGEGSNDGGDKLDELVDALNQSYVENVVK